MDRRSLFALVAALPTLAATSAAARTFALKSPRSSGLENQQVQRLFEAWWRRDELGFRELFTKRLMADGSPMKRDLAEELTKLDPLPPNTFDIFAKMFLDEQKSKRVVLLVNTDGGIFAACAEENYALNTNSDSEVPNLHLFLITMSGLNPRLVTHLTTVATPDPGKFGIWSGN